MTQRVSYQFIRLIPFFTVIALATSIASSAFSLTKSNSVQTYQLDPKQSHITFETTQNGAPFTGSFTRFTADIHFDAKQLANSMIQAEVDLTSVTTAHADTTNALAGPEWFDSKTIPKATFKSTKITASTEVNQYIAEGTLTIKNISKSVKIAFSLNQPEQNKGISVKPSPLIGTAQWTLKRQNYHIGTGEWEKSSTIGSDVIVRCQFYATPITKHASR
jgi:polyisoprenoid-binding protein YceI